jgi:polyphosphate kinase 2 (PPK2 family)
VLIDRVEGLTDQAACERAYATIRGFEHTLTADRYEIVKLFLHISREEQERRLRKREEDPSLNWMVTPLHWERHARYDEYRNATELMLEHTETEWAPWTIVESTDKHYARVKVLETVAATMRQALAHRGLEAPERPDVPDA